MAEPEHGMVMVRVVVTVTVPGQTLVVFTGGRRFTDLENAQQPREAYEDAARFIREQAALIAIDIEAKAPPLNKDYQRPFDFASELVDIPAAKET